MNNSTGDCDLNSSVCVDDIRNLREESDYFSLTTLFATDGRELDFDFDWQANGYVNNIVYMAWKNSPVGSTRLVKYPNQPWGSDIDFANLRGTEQIDAFAELQGYHLLSQHSRFIRDLMGDPNFCFLVTGPNCTVLNPSSNATSLENSSPIRFFVNYQALKATPSPGSRYPDYFTQIRQGLGKNSSYPVLFYENQAYEDAYFARRNFFNGSCQDRRCLSVEYYPFTHFVFGQNTQSDWALNSCLAYHELNHALVAKFLPNLPSYVWTAEGLRSDPGALNEGWADYFAAIHCKISDFRRTYNGRPRRILDNTITCEDTVGQVHTDSQLFSGALWEIRKSILGIGLSEKEQMDFDRIVLQALMTGKETDLFADQMRSILNLLETDDVLKSILPIARRIFNERELDCSRIKPFPERIDPSFSFPPPRITSANLSTIPTQLRIQARSSDWSIHLRWRQYAINSWIGPLDSGYGSFPFQFLVSSCPIQFRGSGGTGIVGISSCTGEVIPWTRSKYSDKYGSYEFALNGSTTAFVMIASDIPASMVMLQTNLTFIGFNRMWRWSLAILGVMEVILLLAWFRIIYLQRLKFPRSFWTLPVVSHLLGSSAGVFSWFAIFFGSNRDIFTWIAFFIWIVHSILDYYFLYIIPVPLWKPQFATRTSSGKLAQLCHCMASAIGLLLVVMSTSSIVFHAIIFSVFILTSVSPIFVPLLLTTKPPSNDEDMISMHSLSSIN
jgi:hypothetical protein